MEEMKNFNSNMFGELSVIMRDGEPWFIAVEVAGKLGYKDRDKAVRRSVCNTDKIKVPYSQFCEEFAPAKMAGANKKTRHLTLLNESGFYQLVLRSKHPKAVEFQHWVTSEILPTIRKHGAYISKELLEQCDNDPSKLESLFNNLKRENKILNNRVESLTDIQKLPTRRELKWDLELDTLSMKQLANMNGIHPFHLRQILLENNVIRTCDTHYRLTDKYKDMGTAVKHFDNDKGDWITYFVFFDTEEVKTFIHNLVEGL